MERRGLFITLEGIDGTGKTTHFRRLVRYLRQRGYTVCATREPGGTVLGEKVRRLLLRGRATAGRGREEGARRSTGRQREAELAPLTELALVYAARAQHLEEVVRPALARGEVVVSDRFNDSSAAYQGYARGLGEPTVRELDRVICGATQPDLTLVLDLDPRQGLKRALGRELRRSSNYGRFEGEGLKFQQRARAGYRAIARREPRRVKLIAADRPPAEVAAEIRREVEELIHSN